jgi:hypothetical protein
MSYVDDVINYIGHSIYTGDPHEDLNLFEFRIYNGALSPADVTASQALGPSQLLGTAPRPNLTASYSSGNFLISWPVSGTTGFSLYASSTLGPNAEWKLVTTTPTVVGQNYQISVAPSGGGPAMFYVLKN